MAIREFHHCTIVYSPLSSRDELFGFKLKSLAARVLKILIELNTVKIIKNSIDERLQILLKHTVYISIQCMLHVPLEISLFSNLS